MKKNLLVFIIALSTVGMFNSCGSSSTREKTGSSDTAAKIEYTCTMHTEVINNKPGKCPVCGMVLVEKK